MSLPAAERNRSKSSRSSRVGRKKSDPAEPVFHPLWAINKLRELEKAGRIEPLSTRAYEGLVALSLVTDNDTGLARCTQKRLGESMRKSERTAWAACQELEDLTPRISKRAQRMAMIAIEKGKPGRRAIIRQDKTGRGASIFVWADDFLRGRRDPSLGVVPLSVPRTRIPGESHTEDRGASKQPAAPPATPTEPELVELDVPAELAALAPTSAGELVAIVRSEHQRAVAIKHPGRGSTSPPATREIMQWALVLGGLAKSDDEDTCIGDAVRRGVALGMLHYMRNPGHKSKGFGDLNEEAHPGLWLPRYLAPIEASVREHYQPKTPRPQVTTTPPTREETLAAAREAKRRVASVGRMLAVGAVARR